MIDLLELNPLDVFHGPWIFFEQSYFLRLYLTLFAG